MKPSLGVNLRVTGHCNQGGRKYMEDAFAVAYQQNRDETDLEYAYFGIFDGHGGREAALFAKEHLMDYIVSQKGFWSEDDNQVLKAIRDGFIATHMAMWKEVGKWPQTVSGLPSTSGSTASVAFIRRGKLYIGHVGDSGVVLGYKEPGCENFKAKQLTRDHKPESPAEKSRIETVGGMVMSKSGVQRVVWNRPRLGHRGPIRRSTRIDQIPFLAVARSLGDLWSYDYFHGEFVVSPEPDVSVSQLNPAKDRCLILASDGLWNMISSVAAVASVEKSHRENDKYVLEKMTSGGTERPCVNPSKVLVDKAIDCWNRHGMRADNISCITVMLDPPGPPRSKVVMREFMLKKLRPRDEVSPLPQDPERRESRILVATAQSYMTSQPLPRNDDYQQQLSSTSAALSSAGKPRNLVETPHRSDARLVKQPTKDTRSVNEPTSSSGLAGSSTSAPASLTTTPPHVSLPSDRTSCKSSNRTNIPIVKTNRIDSRNSLTNKPSDIVNESPGVQVPMRNASSHSQPNQTVPVTPSIVDANVDRAPSTGSVTRSTPPRTNVESQGPSTRATTDALSSEERLSKRTRPSPPAAQFPSSDRPSKRVRYIPYPSSLGLGTKSNTKISSLAAQQERLLHILKLKQENASMRKRKRNETDQKCEEDLKEASVLKSSNNEKPSSLLETPKHHRFLSFFSSKRKRCRSGGDSGSTHHANNDQIVSNNYVPKDLGTPKASGPKVASLLNKSVRHSVGNSYPTCMRELNARLSLRQPVRVGNYGRKSNQLTTGDLEKRNHRRAFSWTPGCRTLRDVTRELRQRKVCS